MKSCGQMNAVVGSGSVSHEVRRQCSPCLLPTIERGSLRRGHTHPRASLIAGAGIDVVHALIDDVVVTCPAPVQPVVGTVKMQRAAAITVDEPAIYCVNRSNLPITKLRVHHRGAAAFQAPRLVFHVLGVYSAADPTWSTCGPLAAAIP